MRDTRKRFVVRLALVVTPAEEGRKAVADVLEELEARPHLGCPQVRWNDGAHHVLVEVLVTNLDAGRAGATMAEELLEIAAVVVSDFETMHVDIVDVTDA